MKVVATGMKPNAEPLHPFFDDALTTNQYLRVRHTLQVTLVIFLFLFFSLTIINKVEGHDNVFAIGDITDLLIPKVWFFKNICLFFILPLLLYAF
jgi:hypothetical protein